MFYVFNTYFAFFNFLTQKCCKYFVTILVILKHPLSVEFVTVFAWGKSTKYITYYLLFFSPLHMSTSTLHTLMQPLGKYRYVQYDFQYNVFAALKKATENKMAAFLYWVGQVYSGKLRVSGHLHSCRAVCGLWVFSMLSVTGNQLYKCLAFHFFTIVNGVELSSQCSLFVLCFTSNKQCLGVTDFWKQAAPVGGQGTDTQAAAQGINEVSTWLVVTEER